ncbi:hypothetical protein [Streptomyces sp. NPDC057253]|uniref:hypothetical protein n=1 Tax=Streptomyces sp. NPDC057253 TaxID=3346069 RepID=UPI00363FBFAF
MMYAGFFGDHLNGELVLAALIGVVGGVAFLGALLMGFLGDPITKRMRPGFEKVVLRGEGQPATTGLSSPRIGFFILIGAAVAAVLQLPYGTNLAYLQAFIVGVGWPTLIGQALSQAENQRIWDLADRVENPPGGADVPVVNPPVNV